MKYNNMTATTAAGASNNNVAREQSETIAPEATTTIAQVKR